MECLMQRSGGKPINTSGVSPIARIKWVSAFAGMTILAGAVPWAPLSLFGYP